MSDAQEPKPKIFVDDDWKERVQAEKEALGREQANTGSTDAAATAESQQAGSSEPVPPASFPLLVSSLATQALLALGQIPDPNQSRPVVRPEIAKHHIDMLGVLEEKTAGNLTVEESNMLAGALHDLRMIFVSAGNAPSARPNSGE